MADEWTVSDSSPRKRLKTSESSKVQSPKLKSKLEDEPCHENQPSAAENSAPRNCAICFLEDGKAVRGEIDCCDHYFCFLCIMEWSKTESRCPMCRRRFASIRRSPKDGVFASERLIKIPVRDQALHYGDTTGSFDPYAEVLCNVCNSTRDESLLLLCDLCDSASHTYCAGLGFTVPEGDWFCHDCTISRAEHANSETNTEDDNQDATMPLALLNAVRQESHRRASEKRPSRVSSDSSKVKPPAAPCRRVIVIDEVPGLGARTFPTAAKKSTESGARTLDRCRNVQSHIKALRENWNALRSGSLSFSSGSSKPRCYNQKHENNSVFKDRSGQVAWSSAKSSQQSTNEDIVGSKDIDRAWKMFDIAKSKHCARGKTSSCPSSKLPPNKASGSKERTIVGSNHCMRKTQQFGYSSVGTNRMEKPSVYNLFEKEIKKHRLPELENERSSRCITKVAAGCSSSLSTTCLPRFLEPSISKNTSSVRDSSCQKNRSISLEERVNQASSNGSEQNRPACSVSLEASDDSVKLKNGSTSTNGTRNDDAKSEIQSLVKLNLKLLSRDKQLGVAVFKEIARTATHSILAACGMEHQKKYGLCSFSSFKCSHDLLSEKIARSNIMPASCQQCFNGFVKDVVNSVVSEKLGCAKFS